MPKKTDKTHEAMQRNARMSYWDREASVDNIRRFLEQVPEMSQSSLANMSGMSSTTVSEVLAGRYAGNVEAVLAKLDAAINGFFERQDAPVEGHFVKTKVAERIHALIQMAIKLNGMAAIYGASGIGKTMALRATARVKRNCVLIQGHPGSASPTRFLRDLLQEISSRYSSAALGQLGDLFDMVVQRLAKSGRPILIDEADVLSTKTMGILRHVYDATGCPVIMVGRPNLVKKIDRTTRIDDIGGALRGRLVLEHDLMTAMEGGRPDRWLFTVDEVVAMLKQQEIRFNPDAARWLCALANVSALDGGREAGGLRYAIKIFQLAITLARSRGETVITLDLCKEANALTRDQQYGAGLTAAADRFMADYDRQVKAG
jgi:DNA transposition AAA+ family ATPase